MKLLKLLIPVAILLAMMSLQSCSLLGSLTGSVKTAPSEKLYTARDVARMFPFIPVDEPLTYGLACRILEHDVTLYCEFPDTAPAGFPREAICKRGVQVCREVLGTPNTPEPPAPSPPNSAV